MGDGDDRPAVVVQVVLQPRHRFGVEVVGRLVEQQQVRLAEQQATERHPPAFAPGQRRHVGIRWGTAQSVHRDLERRVEVPRIGGVDLLLQAGELIGVLLGVVHRQLVEPIEQRPDLGHPLLHVAANVFGGVELRLLLEHSDGRAGRELGLAVELRVDPRHDAQQRRLPGAVVAEHADLGTRHERQRDVGQNLFVRRVAPGQLVSRVDVLGGHGLRL